MKAIASDGGVCPGCLCSHLLVFPGNPTDNTPYTKGILERLTYEDALVPEIWPFEIANNIYVSRNKRNRIDDVQIYEYLALLRALPIRVALQALWKNVELESYARSWDLAAYDAAYLALALRNHIPLATTDEPLRARALDVGIKIAE